MSFADVTFNHFGWYLTSVVGIAIILRFLISWMKVLEYWYMPMDINRNKIFTRFVILFNGFHKDDPFPDFWYNTLLGILELIAFPIFLKAEQYSIIGAWIGFKSISQWRSWNKNRYVFNRFLIVHALMLIVSFVYLQKFVVLPVAK